MGFQFLGRRVLINGTEVDALLPVQDLHLDMVHIHRCQQAHVGQKQFEKIGRLTEPQRHCRLRNAEGRQRDARVLQPQEAVAIPRKLEIFVQIFQNKPLVLAVQFAGDQVENILQIELFLRIIPGDILFVKGNDGLLLPDDVSQVICL